MKYKIDIQFTDEERSVLTMLYGAKAVEKYINDLRTTIEVSFELVLTGQVGVIEGGELN